MKVLTLNLHSYQEEDQLEKFEEIGDKIAELQVDIACFCEASQSLTNKADKIVEEDNALKIICDRVNSKSKDHYEVKWEFSHYGFTVYEEGLGIITKLPVVKTESRYVSKSRSLFDFRSRKILKVTLQDGKDLVDVFVVHTNIENDPYDPFENQFAHIQSWIEESKDHKVILAGDFGIEPNSRSYDRLIEMDYIDYYGVYKPEGMYDYTFINPVGLEFLHEHKQRLDYIIGKEGYSCKFASYYFNDKQVSDHVAVYCELV